MPKIYDCFLFHGELNLLDLRLNILDKSVDKFVICEARQSFNEQANSVTYFLNSDRYKKWEEKIIYYPFNLMEDKELVELARNSDNTNKGNPYWMKVFYAMEIFKKPLQNCADNDIIYISDCDEIWNPDIKIEHDDKIYGFEQLAYYYWLNNRCSEPWTGTIRTSYKRLKNETINHIKQKGEIKLPNGGWHFTYQGGEAEIRRKVQSTRTAGEQDQTDSYYGTPTEFILENARNNRDIFAGRFAGREFRFWTDETEWPEYLKANRKEYQHLLK